MLHRNVELPHNLPPVGFITPSNLFLLNPENSDMLIGKRKFTIPINFIFITSLLLFLLLLISILLLVTGINNTLTATYLSSSETSVEGVITGQRKGVIGNISQTATYFVTYQFNPTESKTPYHKEQGVRDDLFNKLKTGDSVRIKYLPTDPNVSTLAEVDMNASLGFMGSLLIIIGALGTLITGVYLLPVVSAALKELHLRRYGKILNGQVLSCRRYKNEAPTSLNPHEYGSALSNLFFIELSYRFKLPDGKEITSWDKRKRDDLKGKSLPTFGLPIAVLYLDEKHYKVL
jgi:hypothetical protein